MNKQQLANKIWASANKMRSKIEANEYKDYILGLIFYKFLSDNEVNYLNSIGWTDEDIVTLVEDHENQEAVMMMEYCRNNIGYFIEYQNLFATWLKPNSEFSVADLSGALSSFDRLISPHYKHVYENIFKTLQAGLSKLGENPASQTRAIKDLIKLIKDIPTDGRQDYDVLGYVYEYLISNFAANAGKKAGEFYTPHEVAILMSEIVAEHHKNKDKIEIYDPTSGSGSLLITIGKSVGRHIEDKNKVKYYAQELKENTYNLTRMNLVMRGIKPDNINTRCADSLEEDWPLQTDGGDIGKPLYVDAVVSNPPYSQQWDANDRELDPRFKDYGVAPKSKADYAFLLHELHHLKPDGILTIVLPHGVLFRGDADENSEGEGKIRRNLIEKNNIDAIIGLPANIFFGTGIPTLIMVLKQHRDNDDVLIIDASKGFVKEGKNNKLRECDIKRIADTVRDRKTVPGYSRTVSRDEIRQNGYNLNIPRYVDSSDPVEKFDIYATMFGGIPHSEIDELQKYWDTFPSLREELFIADADKPYSQLKTEDTQSFIEQNADVKAFQQMFAQAFGGFADSVHHRLIDQIATANPQNIYNCRLEIPETHSEKWVSINDNPKSAINLAKTICTEGQKLSEQFPGIVLLIFIPNSWSNYRQFNYHGETFDLHNYIKAFAAQHRFTTQFIEEKTLYDKMVCEISWWLSLALFVKALRTPWTLADLDQNTAYAGIGYSIKKQYSGKAEVVLGCSHIYNAQGQGLRYKLSKVEHPQFDKKKNPYLNFEEAYKFGMDILALFQDAMEKLPQRVVIHKRTPFKNDEIEGITNALKQAGISEIDLITITQEYDLKFIAEKIMYGQFLEDGYPVDRGTCIKLSSRNALLWTHGVVPSIQSNRRYYQGGRCIPAPLKITKYYGHGDLETIAKEILEFTKMNWNSFNLYTKLPATIDTSNTLAQVGNLLRQYNGVTYDYRFFI